MKDAIPAGQDLAGEESEKGLLGRKQSSSTSRKVGRSGAYTGSSQFSSAVLLGASGRAGMEQTQRRS